jgi:hypothetical protein
MAEPDYAEINTILDAVVAGSVKRKRKRNKR